MIIYPAIDLLDGECVRLYKGDYGQSTHYSNMPRDVAARFEEEGAEWLHLVDLSGARDPEARQLGLIGEIIQHTSLKVQTGGGIRSADDVRALLDTGAQRVVIGSLAVKDIITTTGILETFGPEKICLAMDVRRDEDGTFKLATGGWQEDSVVRLEDLLEDYEPHGLKHILCTDIDRDGTMEGPNTDLYDSLCLEFGKLDIQASGGISSLDDITALAHTHVAGAITGRALYEEAFTVSQALGRVASC